ncbi:hypothetical protein HY312_04040 [Candidatus Saccharibacteria bacterium]|nr:hypothetical protein [Candidatus Saccharibacteria bacterium]
MRETYRLPEYLRVYAFISAVLLAISALTLGSLPVYADPLEDKTAPVLTPNIRDGDQRNIVTFLLAVNDDNRKDVSIEVLSSDDHSLMPRVFTQGETGAQNLSLSWDTRAIDRGDYRVRYTATDYAGQKTEEIYSFKVNNAQPFVTLNEKADGRTIGGSVSRSDVVFQVRDDGNLIAATPVISENPDQTGAFIWTLSLPTSVTDGVRSIDVNATVIGSNETSGLVNSSINISTLLKVAEPTTNAPIPTVISIADRVQEIGQFIAPNLPTTPQTQLYGVSTTDLTSGGPSEERMVTSPQRATAVAFRGDIQSLKNTDTTVPIAATESGWFIFGVAWYWWMLSGTLLAAAIIVMMRALRQRQAKTVFVGAKSL